MAFSKYAPSRVTSAFIESYWIVDDKDTTVKVEKIIPDGFTEIKIHHGDPYCKKWKYVWQQKAVLSCSMKKTTFPALMILFFTAGPGALLAQKPTDGFHGFSFMLGTWAMESKKGKLYEDWTRKDDTTLTGKSYYVSGKDTIITEYHELVIKGDDLVYMANPKNQSNHDQPVPFKLISSVNGTLVFENKAHDFPQRVVYHITPGSTSVTAWIEGELNGQPRKITFPYTKLPG